MPRSVVAELLLGFRIRNLPDDGRTAVRHSVELWIYLVPTVVGGFDSIAQKDIRRSTFYDLAAVVIGRIGSTGGCKPWEQCDEEVVSKSRIFDDKPFLVQVDPMR